MLAVTSSEGYARSDASMMCRSFYNYTSAYLGVSVQVRKKCEGFREVTEALLEFCRVPSEEEERLRNERNLFHGIVRDLSFHNLPSDSEH